MPFDGGGGHGAQTTGIRPAVASPVGPGPSAGAERARGGPGGEVPVRASRAGRDGEPPRPAHGGAGLPSSGGAARVRRPLAGPLPDEAGVRRAGGIPPQRPPAAPGPAGRSRAEDGTYRRPLPARPGAGPLPAEEDRRARPAGGTPRWATGEWSYGNAVRAVPQHRRSPRRTLAAAVCGLLGLGLIGAAVTGPRLTGDSSADSPEESAYATARTLWHSAPVDTLFPRTLHGGGAGPGRADRVWTRVAVAPDADCVSQLPPALLTALRPTGCSRVLRATYTDATASHVTTVGLVFTEGDATAMRALAARFERDDLARDVELLPRTLPAPGTVAERFGRDQRASWTVEALTEAPVVVQAVSGFADGRPVAQPQPASDARARGARTAPAQAGLGHEAQGLADAVTRALRTALRTAAAGNEGTR